MTAQRFEDLQRWVSGFQLSVRLSAGSLGAGWVSWKEIKQVFKPAWQAVKILPGFCQFCRKYHTPQASKLRSAGNAFPFLWIFLRFQKLSLVPIWKKIWWFSQTENWEKKRGGMGQLKILFQKYFLNYFFPRQNIHWNQFYTSKYFHFKNLTYSDEYDVLLNNNCTLISNVCLHHSAITEHTESCKNWGFSS